MSQQYLTFKLAGEDYGVGILSVQEIRGWSSVTAMPNSPPWLLGIVDLPRLFADAADGGRMATEIDEDTQVLVLVLGKAHAELGLLIDEVLEGRTLGADVVPVGAHESGTARGLIGGATGDGVRLIVAEALMNDPRLFLEREQEDQPQPRE